MIKDGHTLIRVSDVKVYGNEVTKDDQILSIEYND